MKHNDVEMTAKGRIPAQSFIDSLLGKKQCKFHIFHLGEDVKSARKLISESPSGHPFKFVTFKLKKIDMEKRTFLGVIDSITKNGETQECAVTLRGIFTEVKYNSDFFDLTMGRISGTTEINPQLHKRYQQKVVS